MKMNSNHCSAIRKLCSLFLVMTLVICGMGLTAHAQTVTADLVTLEDDMNLAVAVTYTDDGTGTVPQIAFVGPDGKVYDSSNVETDQSENTLYFYIPDAWAGDWKIQYDDAFSGRLEVTTAPYSRDILIEQFDVQFDSDLMMYDAEVSCLTSFPVNMPLNYVINAVTLNSDGSIMGTKELQTGYAVTNEEFTAYVNLGNLSTYSDYYLQLVVYVNDHGVEVTDSLLSDPFGYENPDAPGMMDDFDIILNRTTGDLKIDWSKVQKYNAGEYIVAVFSSLTPDEPVYVNTFTENITNTSLLIDASADWIRVEMSYVPTDIPAVSQVKAVTIEPNAVDFEITTGENTASLQAQISYNVPSGQVDLYVFVHDDGNLKPKTVSGSGTVAFDLEENDNTLYVAYKPSEHVVIMESKEIFVDRKAPILTFFEDLTSVTTKDAVFRVAGMTEAGAVVTVNGSAVQINADGSFLIALNLNPGANSFEIISADPAGNLSRRIVLINRSDVASAVGSDDVQPFWKTWMPLFIAVGASLILAILILVLFGGKNKRTPAQTLKRWSILMWIFSAVGLGITVWLLIEKVMASDLVNSTQFFDLVQASIDEAYDAILELQFFDHWFMIALIVTAVLVVIAIGLLVAAIIVGKNQNKPPKPPKAPKPPKQPKQPKAKKEKLAPAVIPEPVAEPAPAPVAIPEPVAEPAPAPAVIPEPVAEPAPAPVVIPEPVAEPAPAPVVIPEPVAEPAPAVKPQTPKFCSNCGHPCAEGAVFCMNCGAKLR
jgi:hypothetical protein